MKFYEAVELMNTHSKYIWRWDFPEYYFYTVFDFNGNPCMISKVDTETRMPIYDSLFSKQDVLNNSWVAESHRPLRKEGI